MTNKVPPKPRGMFESNETPPTPPEKESIANVEGMKNQQRPEKPPGTKKPQKATPQKETKKNPPAKQKTRAELEQIRDLRLKKMTFLQLVTEAPEQRFVKAIAGDIKNKLEVSKAKKIFAQERSFAMQMFRSNDYLRKCAEGNREAVLDAMENVALSGLTLNPNLKLAYLVPFDKKVVFWASYMGKREIVMRSGQVKDAYARLVYESERDGFDIKYGTGGYLKHKPDPWGEKTPDKIIGGYWVCILKDGTEKFDTMPKAEIEALKARSAAVKAGKGSPWDTDYEQMALKTIFNRGFKEMPKTGLSDAQLKAMEVEGKLEEETHKKWVKTTKVKQDNFDDDYPEVEDADAQVVE